MQTGLSEDTATQNKAFVHSGPFGGLTRNVFVTGLVSLLTDVSSEMIYPILPLFLANVLGAGAVTIGLIEGIAESTASLLKVFSGWLSDRFGRRKPLMVAGYGFSNLIKPLLALSTVWWHVLGIRFADRVGKGIRGAPRDALIADSTTQEVRGKAFGFHRTLDTIGAAIGPMAAFAILAAFQNDYRLVFVLSAIPGVLSVIVLVVFLRERRAPRPRAKELPKLGFGSLGRPFLVFSLIATVFTLGNSSDAFLILRAQDLGLATALVPIAYLTFNITYTLLAMPFGSLSDKIGRRAVIVGGYLVFAAVYLGFAFASAAWAVWGLFAAYGFYYALTEGVQRAYVADLVPQNVRGSAMGTFNALVGITALPASIVGGTLWQVINPSATFVYGAAFAVLAALLLAVVPIRAARTYHITFYTKEGCTLCRGVEGTLAELQHEYRLRIDRRDITADPALYEEYKEIIPVVVIDDDIRLSGRITEGDMRRGLKRAS
ncbi:MAG: MFS transporter [Chloroflexi bacterium]|nr:MFS transporter [Chloroflexota bacterium]